MIKICFHADNDTNADAQAVNAAMVGENADLYCFVGDGPYAKTGTKWVAQQKKHFDDKKDKMVWSRGNHDTKSSESMQTQRDMEAWFPEAKKLGIDDTWLYSKQVGNVYVISMDTEDMDVEFERDQFNFVKAELAKAKQLRQSGQIDWIVVLFHKPFFTLKSSHSPYTAVRFLYKDLFRDAQVDFAVSGHNHNTQLWKPMIPNQSQANGEGEQLFKFASDGKTFDFAQDHGALYIVTGHSAHEWNGINDSGSGVTNVMHYRDSGDFGYTLIEFDGKKSKVLSKDTTGKVHFEYNVTRDGGIITNPPPDNKPPIANAGPDKIVAKKSNIMLNGSQSTDPDGTILKSYKWTQVNGPNVVLNNSNSAIASFTSPDEDNKAMTFQLEVTDDKGAKATDTVTITTSSSPPPTEIVCPFKYHYEDSLKKCVPDLEPDFEPICPEGYKWNGIVCKWIGGGGEPPENKPPVADAGNDETVKPKSNVMLNGSKSSDPEGTVLTIFEWKQLSGPANVTLSNKNTVNPTFAAPDKEGQYIFQLTVADDRGLKDTDTVTITVKKDAPQPQCPPGQHLENGVCVPDSPTGGGDVLWDSNIHLKTGQKYTITGKHGSQEINGKGVFMAASGNPRLIVEADGTFHLEADAGHGRVYIQAQNYNARMEGEVMFPDNVVRNTTWRLRSRHNEGGACENRFGGFGATHERAEQLAEYATEPCHNIHENTVKKPLAKKIEVGKWIKFRYSVCNSADNKQVLFKTEYDYGDGNGFVTVLEGKHSSPKPYYMAVDDFLVKRSYAWLRINNEKTGKVTYKNVRIVKITSI